MMSNDVARIRLRFGLRLDRGFGDRKRGFVHRARDETMGFLAARIDLQCFAGIT